MQIRWKTVPDGWTRLAETTFTKFSFCVTVFFGILALGFCCVRFSFFRAMLSDWLGGTFLKDLVMCCFDIQP